MTWEALASFLSGVGAVIGARHAIRLVVKRCDEQCDKRMAAFREGLHEARDADH